MIGKNNKNKISSIKYEDKQIDVKEIVVNHLNLFYVDSVEDIDIVNSVGVSTNEWKVTKLTQKVLHDFKLY